MSNSDNNTIVSFYTVAIVVSFSGFVDRRPRYDGRFITHLRVTSILRVVGRGRPRRRRVRKMPRLSPILTVVGVVAIVVVVIVVVIVIVVVVIILVEIIK